MRQDAPSWVRDRLVPADTAHGIRDAIVEDLMRLAGSRAGLYYGVAMVDGALCYTGLQLHDGVGRMDHLRACEGRPISDFADLTPSVLTTVNRFGVNAAEEYRDNRMYPLMLEPLGVLSILAMTAAVGGCFVGWVGCYRLHGEQPFEKELLARAQERADAYIHALDIAWRLDDHAEASRAIVGLDPRGNVHFCCSEGRAWLADDAFAKGLREACLEGSAAPRYIQGAIVRLTPLAGAEGARVFAEIAPVDEWRVPPIASLSVRKRRIAEFAAFGATAAEIGRALDVSPETVRAHLKRIYERLGVANRVELAACVREAFESS